jgi:hypothetical protein
MPQGQQQLNLVRINLVLFFIPEKRETHENSKKVMISRNRITILEKKKSRRSDGPSRPFVGTTGSLLGCTLTHYSHFTFLPQ